MKVTINQLYTRGVDTSIFRAGTLTVYGDLLGVFNQAVCGTINCIHKEENVMNRLPDVEVIFEFNGTRRNPASDGYWPAH